MLKLDTVNNGMFSDIGSNLPCNPLSTLFTLLADNEHMLSFFYEEPSVARKLIDQDCFFTLYTLIVENAIQDI